MEFINRAYLLTAFLIMTLFSQTSNAIIITNYTAFFEDGSKLVVDLKGYDYGIGSYYAAPNGWTEGTLPPVEGFDTFFYPSWSLQQYDMWDDGIPSGKLETAWHDFGLHFNVDEHHGVSMTSFSYVFSLPDLVISDQAVDLYHYDISDNDGYYISDFSGGFFKTYTSLYQVDEPGSLALMIIGIAGLGWVRLRKKSERTGTLFPDFVSRLFFKPNRV